MVKVRVYKQESYEQALVFRQRGFTYAEIAKICNVSRGTISNWFKNEPFSQSVTAINKKRAVADNKKRLALINKARVAERKSSYRDAEHAAVTEFKHYRQSPLFIAGVTAYMASGDLHASHPIRLSSADAVLQRLYMQFVYEFLGVTKADIHVWLLLYPTHNEVACMKWWMRKTGVSAASFYKNQVIPSQARKIPLHFGVLNTIIGSTLLKKKLLVWVSLLKKELKIT